jgi:hypothetical protein
MISFEINGSFNQLISTINYSHTTNWILKNNLFSLNLLLDRWIFDFIKYVWVKLTRRLLIPCKNDKNHDFQLKNQNLYDHKMKDREFIYNDLKKFKK